MKGVNWLGLGLALVFGHLVGFVWYGLLFEEAWKGLTGVVTSGDSMDPAMAWGLLNTAIVVTGLALLIPKLGATSIGGGAKVGLSCGFFFAFTTVAQDAIYMGEPLQLLAIDAGHLLVAYTVIGATLGAFKPKAA